MEDARRVANQLDMPFYVLNYEDVFEHDVIEPFCDSYLAGQTPNPCVLCNARIKFSRLLATALALGADFLATGHYARVERDAAGCWHLCKAHDARQDQSYFLYPLTEEQLARTLFPLARFSKRDVRQIASALGLHVAHKPGSQDICFVPGGDYRRFLALRYPVALQAGPIVDSRGVVLGQHAGVARYTVGQRKGLGLATGRPMYVQALDAARRTVIVGSKEDGYSETLLVKQVNWLGSELPRGSRRVEVKTRYRAPEVAADVTPRSDDTVAVRFTHPQPAVAPGQSAVFYDGDIVLGGGIVSVDREVHT
jgi:tRNA-specific 2-thiouridylase